MEELLYEVVEGNQRIALFNYTNDLCEFIAKKNIGSEGITIRCRCFKVEDCECTEDDIDIGC